MIQIRYALQFYRESDAEIRERKELARHSLQYHNEKGLEIDPRDYFVQEVDFPKRPSWSFDMTRESLEAKEQKYFNVWLFYQLVVTIIIWNLFSNRITYKT